MTGKLLVTPTEAAELLSMSRSKVYDLIRRGELPAVKIAGMTRVPVRSLEAWIAGIEEGNAGSEQPADSHAGH